MNRDQIKHLFSRIDAVNDWNTCCEYIKITGMNTGRLFENSLEILVKCTYLVGGGYLHI